MESKTEEMLNKSEELDKNTPKGEVKTIFPDGFWSEEDLKYLNILNMHAKIRDMKQMSKTFDDETLKAVESKEVTEWVDKQIKDYTVEEIKAMSHAKIKEIYTKTNEDGTAEELKMSVDLGDDKEQTEFKRDFMVLRKESLNSLEELDKEMEQLENDLKESNIQIDDILDRFGDLSGYVHARLERLVGEESNPDKKQRYSEYLKQFEYGYNLENVIEYTKTWKGSKILSTYHNEKMSQSMYNKYKKNNEALRCKQDLTKFGGIEKKYLPEQYHKRDNLFLFAVIHMIASWKPDSLDVAQGLFLSQLCINVKNLTYNNFAKEELREGFIKNIEKVIEAIVF